MKSNRVLLGVALALVLPVAAAAWGPVCVGFYSTSTQYGTGAVCSDAQNEARINAQLAVYGEHSCPFPYVQPCNISTWVSDCWLGNGTCNAEAVAYYGCLECLDPEGNCAVW